MRIMVAMLRPEPCWRDSIAASRRRGIARGSEREYMAGNLLGLEVTAADVAQAFDLLALAGKTSAAVVAVDGGNTAAVVR